MQNTERIADLTYSWLQSESILDEYQKMDKPIQVNKMERSGFVWGPQHLSQQVAMCIYLV